MQNEDEKTGLGSGQIMKSKFTLLYNQEYRGVFVRYPNGFAFVPFGCFVHEYKVVPVPKKLDDDQGFVVFRNLLITVSTLAVRAKVTTGIYVMDFRGNFEQIHRMKQSLDDSCGLRGVKQSEIINWESREVLACAA